MTSLPGLDDIEVASRRVLVRCDLNVPLDGDSVADDMRIRASIGNLQALLHREARLAICSHLGRPKGEIVKELSLAPVGDRLADLLGKEVTFAGDVVGEEAQTACEGDAQVVLLENLRFEAGEEANDPGFAAALASLGDAFVNDAFGAAHRAHASVVGVPGHLPSAAGLLLATEVEKLSRLLEDPEQPFVAVLGGAKVSDKLGVIGNLLERVQAICVGGAMANTLLAASGKDVGNSKVEADRLDEVAGVLERAASNDVEIYLPSDVIAADSPDEDAAYEEVAVSEIGPRMALDIGPHTRRAFATVIEGARSVLWNGPMGIFEMEPYAGGTRAVAKAIAAATASGAYTVAGGGDSAAALAEMDMTDAVSHLSTGGGASLEFLEGIELPGIAALTSKGRDR